jgi:electron transport complex protein RnfE
MTSSFGLIVRGLLAENPVFRLALSMCPAVAVTTNIKNGFLLGCAVVFVQVMSNITVSIMRKVVHQRVRVVVYTIIIATWVSVIDMVMAAYFPDLYDTVALYIKLIVVFAIIISRLELFASKNPLAPSFFDGLGMGLGFMVGLMLIGAVREFLGSGALLGISVLPVKPMLIMILPAGGFFVIGFLMAIFNIVLQKLGMGAPPAGGHH